MLGGVGSISKSNDGMSDSSGNYRGWVDRCQTQDMDVGWVEGCWG